MIFQKKKNDTDMIQLLRNVVSKKCCAFLLNLIRIISESLSGFKVTKRATFQAKCPIKVLAELAKHDLTFKWGLFSFTNCAKDSN